MGPGFPPSHGDAREKLKEPKPKNLKEVPHYLSQVFGGTFRRLFYIFTLVWEAQPFILFMMIFMSVFNGVTPVISATITANLLEEVVNNIEHTSTSDALMTALVIQFIFLFVRSFINTLDNTLTRISGEVVTNHIKNKIMNKAKTVDVASFDMPDFYERMENANREAGVRPISILSSAFSVISKVITLCSFTVVLFGLFSEIRETSGDGRFLFTVVFAVIFLILSVVSAVVSFYFRRQNFLYMRHRSKDRRKLNYFSDVLVNKDLVKELRLFNLSDLFIGRYNEVFSGYFKGIKKLIYKENFYNLLLSMLTTAVNSTLIYMIATNIKAIASYSMYSAALSNISGAVSGLINTSASIYEGTLFIDNLILFMNEPQRIRCEAEQPVPVKRHVGHTLELKNVSFSYPGSERKVLKNVNLTLNAGDTVVLVGLNGAGKTTLIKLITRLYDSTEGEILLDGVNIKHYQPSELYKLYGIIFQDFGKYAVSASENIAFGDISRKEDAIAIKKAAENSGADAFIQKMANGYETPMMRYFEKDGAELSIGQWQKLSVARAFFADSDILILDEPTASLDAIAEQEIFDQFDRLRKDKTTVFVSHRLSSATVANKIVVLKDGEIVELGDHRSLMAAKGEYYTLFTTQATRYITGGNESLPTDASNGEILRDLPQRAPPHGNPPRDFPQGPHLHDSMPKAFPLRRNVQG